MSRVLDDRPQRIFPAICGSFFLFGAYSRKIKQEPAEKLISDEKQAIPPDEFISFSGFHPI
jgi:hypothetical protein